MQLSAVQDEEKFHTVSDWVMPCISEPQPHLTAAAWFHQVVDGLSVAMINSFLDALEEGYLIYQNRIRYLFKTMFYYWDDHSLLLTSLATTCFSPLARPSPDQPVTVFSNQIRTWACKRLMLKVLHRFKLPRVSCSRSSRAVSESALNFGISDFLNLRSRSNQLARLAKLGGQLTLFICLPSSHPVSKDQTKKKMLLV